MRRVLASECVDGVEPDPALVRRWSRRTFDSYARYWADGARLPYETEAGVRARWQLRLEERRAPARRHGPSDAASSWRCPTWGAGSGAATGSALEGMPMTAVVERLEPEELFEWFVGQRGRHGADRGAARRRLELGAPPGAQGRSASPGSSATGTWSATGSRSSSSARGPRCPAGAATLALRTGAPLLPVVVYSGPGNWHTGVVHPPLDTTRRGTLREDIVRVTQDLATHVRATTSARHPEQWHLYQPNWPSDPRDAMRIAMLSPYSLSRPGACRARCIGLARSLRARVTR